MNTGVLGFCRSQLGVRRARLWR